MSVLLTPEEIMQQYDLLPTFVSPESSYSFMRRQGKQFAKAQLREVIKWGEDHCPHAGPVDDDPIQWKKHCNACWNELKREVDGDF